MDNIGITKDFQYNSAHTGDGPPAGDVSACVSSGNMADDGRPTLDDKFDFSSPLLIGGVQPLSDNNVVKNESKLPSLTFFAKNFDFLTLTSSPEFSRFLLSKTEHEEYCRRSDQGFEKKEMRACGCGFASRRFSPYGSESMFGPDYESWVFSGHNASWWVPKCVKTGLGAHGAICYSSRLDIAFDFFCDDDFYPRDFTRSLNIDDDNPHLDHRGHVKTGTRYFYKRDNPLMFRIYRKDLEDIAVAKTHGPVLRVEVELKKELSRYAWFSMLDEGSDWCFDFCGTLLQQHIGFNLFFYNKVDVPDFPKVSTDALSKIAYFVEQSAATYSYLDESGVDITGLLLAKAKLLSKSSKSRTKQRYKEVRNSDITALNEFLYDMVKK